MVVSFFFYSSIAAIYESTKTAFLTKGLHFFIPNSSAADDSYNKSHAQCALCAVTFPAVCATAVAFDPVKTD